MTQEELDVLYSIRLRLAAYLSTPTDKASDDLDERLRYWRDLKGEMMDHDVVCRTVKLVINTVQTQEIG